MSYYPLYNTFFAGVPRTGSTTIRNILGTASLSNERTYISQERMQSLGSKRVPSWRRRQVITWNRHPKVSDVMNISKEAKELIENAFKFAVVRNPYDRIVSSYCFYIDSIKKHNSNLPLYNFKEYVQNVVVPCKTTHVLPQHEFVCVGGKISVDKITKYENFSEGLNEVFSIIGIKNYTIKKLNASAREEFGSYFDKELYNVISVVYKKDFELFDYEMQE